jgi:hypothetical protein
MVRWVLFLLLVFLLEDGPGVSLASLSASPEEEPVDKGRLKEGRFKEGRRDEVRVDARRRQMVVRERTKDRRGGR